MPFTKVDCGTGVALALAALGFECEVLGIAVSGIAAEILDTTHHGTAVPTLPPTPGATKFGSKTFMAGDHVDPGSLKVDVHFAPGYVPPVGVADAMTLTWPLPKGKTTAAKWEGAVIVQAYEGGAPLEGKMVGSLTLKLSGQQTITQES